AMGDKMKATRLARRMSQEALGERLGVTFQQVQKYEKGTNFLTVVRALQIAAVLELNALEFIPTIPARIPRDDPLRELGTSSQGMRMARAFNTLSDTGMREVILALVEHLAGFE